MCGNGTPPEEEGEVKEVLVVDIGDIELEASILSWEENGGETDIWRSSSIRYRLGADRSIGGGLCVL